MGFDTQENPQEVKKRIGVIGDKSLLYGELTGRENILFYAQLYDVPRQKASETVELLSDRFGVTSRMDEQTRILSTGLRKRVDIIRSLIHSPDLLLLDEPFSGLDRDSAEIFINYLLENRSHESVVVTTHDPALGRRVCDDFVMLRKGRITSQGPISEFEQEV
jgi:sodium transport system ATP-binding protein